MKVLYALQGTGNGHLSRALEILPVLSNYCSFDVLISGHNCDLNLPFPVRYTPSGISMSYDDHGAISLRRSWKQLNSREFLKEVLALPVRDYDLVICDFEPVSAYAALMRGVPSYALSHQAAFLSPLAPRPLAKSRVAESILKWFAPCNQSLGFHFQSYDDFIFGPVIRDQIRRLNARQSGHAVVYLPAFSDVALTDLLTQIQEIEWHIFARGISEPRLMDNCLVMPVSESGFLQSLAGCDAVLCGAGFELPSEALFLKKKLAVIPIRGQYEQQCNSAALKSMGIAAFDTLPAAQELRAWLMSEQPDVTIAPANVHKCLDFIFEDYYARKKHPASSSPRFSPSYQLF